MKKFLFLALIAVIAFAACQNGVQEVEGDVGVNGNAAPAPGKPTVTVSTDKTLANGFYIVSWEAAEAVSGYSVVVQYDGKKSINNVGYASNSWIYKADGGGEANTAPDTYYSKVDFDSIPAYKAGAVVKFGVMSNSSLKSETNKISSEIVWADPVTLP